MQKPPYFHVLLRNGQRAIARAILAEEKVPAPWGLCGFRQHFEQIFQGGDPELWRLTGHWREDALPHLFDIIESQRVVNFSQPDPPTTSTAPLPEVAPNSSQEHWLDKALHEFLEKHGTTH